MNTNVLGGPAPWPRTTWQRRTPIERGLCGVALDARFRELATERPDAAVALMEVNFGPVLERWLQFELPDPSLARDLVQDTVALMITRWPTLDLTLSARAWMFSLARNQMRNLRRRQRRELREHGDLVETQSPVQSGTAWEIRGRWKTRTLSQLPEDALDLLRMYYEESLTCGEIARLTGETGTLEQGAWRVSKRIHRLIDALQAAARADGVMHLSEPGPITRETWGVRPA